MTKEEIVKELNAAAKTLEIYMKKAHIKELDDEETENIVMSDKENFYYWLGAYKMLNFLASKQETK